MKVYVINFVVGGYYSSLNNVYLKTLEEGRSEYLKSLQDVGEDPTLVYLSELDLETMKETTIESFEGTYEDLEDEEVA